MASKILVNLDTSKEFFLNSKCKQNDDLILECSIFENGLAKDLSNCSIVIQALKADKTYIIQNTDITKENNKFTANLVRDFTRVPGKTEIEIVLTESSKQNTTFSFCLEVVGSVIRGAVESPNTVTILENLQEKILEAGAVKEETEQLIEKGGAATKGEIQEVNAQLEQNNSKGVETVLGKRGILQASVIRNTGDGWKFINGDNVHDEINFNNVSVEGNRIRLDSKPVKLIGSTVVTPDDTLAGYGLTCGASVGTEKSYINCYAPFGGVLDGDGVLTINSWFYDTFTVTKLVDGTGFEILYDGNSNVKEPVLATTIRSGSTQHSGLEIFASRDAYNKATFRAYNDLYGHVAFNGTNWVVTTSCVANIVSEWNKYNDSTLVITHDTIPPISGYNAFQSININLRTPISGNLIHGRIERVTQTEIRVAFYDKTGVKITTPNTDMRLFFSRPGFKVPHIWNTYCRANISLGQTIVRPDKLVHANGNLWVLGLNQSY